MIKVIVYYFRAWFSTTYSTEFETIVTIGLLDFVNHVPIINRERITAGQQ